MGCSPGPASQAEMLVLPPDPSEAAGEVGQAPRRAGGHGFLLAPCSVSRGPCCTSQHRDLLACLCGPTEGHIGASFTGTRFSEVSPPTLQELSVETYLYKEDVYIRDMVCVLSQQP